MKIVQVLAVLWAMMGPVWWASAAEGVLTRADTMRLANAGIGEGGFVGMMQWLAPDSESGDGSVVELEAVGVGNAVMADMIAPVLRGASPGNVRGPLEVAMAPSSRAGDGGSELAASQPQVIPGSTFREALRSGGEGPQMVVIPAGRFRMGCLSNDDDCFSSEKPVHEVTIGRSFALSVHEVTFEDYDRFTQPNKVDDRGWGRGRRPATMVSWDDAQEYVAWLSAQTGGEYRLPSEAEWEYATRAGAPTKYSWGHAIGVNRANCNGCGSQWDNRRTAPVGSFRANEFGLHDMHGNVFEWVADC